MEKKNVILVLLIFVFFVVNFAGFVRGADSDYLNLANEVDILFVDGDNGDCSDAYSRVQAMNGSTPLCNLDSAMDKVESGDTVYVLGGTYRGRFDFQDNILTDKVTFAAYPGETAILTNTLAVYEQNPNSQWMNMSNSTHNMWNSSTNSWGGGYIAAYQDGTHFFSYGTWEGFINLSLPEGTYTNDTADEIWIRFNNASKNPNNLSLFISDRYDEVVYFGNNSGAQIEFANFTVQYGKRQIMISNNSNVIISGSTIISGYVGIYLKTGSLSNITIKNNEIYSNFNSDWGWTDIKNGPSNYMETTAIWALDAGSNNEYYNNTIHGYFNGIAITSSNKDYNTNARFYNNTIYDIYDDAIEIENYCDNSSIFNNKVYDVFAGVSLAPSNASKSKCNLYGNLILSNKTIKWSDTSNASIGCFKIGSGSGKVSNWNIYHNTCQGGDDQSGIEGLANDAQYNLTWSNNIFYTNAGYAVYKSGLNSSYVTYDYNLYFRNDSSYLFKYWNDDADTTTFNTLQAALISSNAPSNWDGNSLNVNPLFISSSTTDFQLQWNSPAIDSGTNINLITDYAGNPIYGTPDMGAYEYQPPYNISSDNINSSISKSIRIYGDGKFRYINSTTSSINANLIAQPTAGFSSTNYSKWMDINFTTWTSSLMNWTESSNNIGSSSVTHTICDLSSGNHYEVYYTKSGIRTLLSRHTVDSSGCITFNYAQGYSTITFDMQIYTPVIEPTTSGGGGYPTYYITESNLQEGYSKSLGKKWKIKLKFQNETYELKVDDIQNNSVTITISSDPVTFNLSTNETKKIDLNNNGFYDLSVLLKSITGNSYYYYEADLYLKLINEKIPQNQQDFSGKKNPSNESNQQDIFKNIKNNKSIYWTFGIILAAIILAFVILKLKTKKKIKKEGLEKSHLTTNQ